MNWDFIWYSRVGVDGDEVDGQEQRTETLRLMVYPFRVIFRSFVGGDSPPFRSIDEATPLIPGSNLKFVDTEENEVDLTLVISGSSKYEMYRYIQLFRLEDVFNPSNNDRTVYLNSPPAPENSQTILTGNGKLRVKTPGALTYTENGVEKFYYRDLICRCISGFNVDEARLSYAHMFIKLTFRANYPYWRSSRQLSVALGTRNESPDPPDPVSPLWFKNLNLNPGGNQNYQKVFSITNYGTVSTYPVWTFHGPGTAPYLLNQSTGKTLSFPNCVIDKRQDLIIDPEKKKAYIVGAGSVLNTIDIKSQFWELIPGRNDIDIRMANANQYSRVSFTYYERFLGVY